MELAHLGTSCLQVVEREEAEKERGNRKAVGSRHNVGTRQTWNKSGPHPDGRGKLNVTSAERRNQDRKQQHKHKKKHVQTNKRMRRNGGGKGKDGAPVLIRHPCGPRHVRGVSPLVFVVLLPVMIHSDGSVDQGLQLRKAWEREMGAGDAYGAAGEAHVQEKSETAAGAREAGTSHVRVHFESWNASDWSSGRRSLNWERDLHVRRGS